MASPEREAPMNSPSRDRSSPVRDRSNDRGNRKRSSSGERRRSASPRRRSPSPAGARRRSVSPGARRRSVSPGDDRGRRRSPSPGHRRRSPSPGHRRRSPSPGHRRRSPSPGYRRRSPSPRRDRDRRYRSRSRSGDRAAYGRPPRREPPRRGLQMFVAGFNFMSSERDVEHQFSRYGHVTEVRIVRDSFGKSRGFGFVAMDNEDDVQDCIRAMNGRDWEGRRLQVELCKNPK